MALNELNNVNQNNSLPWLLHCFLHFPFCPSVVWLLSRLVRVLRTVEVALHEIGRIGYHLKTADPVKMQPFF